MLYPLMVKLAGKRCVVVGGGKVAERRIEALSRQDAIIHMIAPEATFELQAMSSSGRLTWMRAPYSPDCLDGAFLVIAATNIRNVNRAVTLDAQARNLLVTCADEPAEGNYLTPSVIERGDLLIALSTSGASPTLAAILRGRLESEFGAEWCNWTSLFGRLRSQIQQVSREADRKALAIQILDNPTIKRLLDDDQLNEAEAAASQCISSHLGSAMSARL